MLMQINQIIPLKPRLRGGPIFPLLTLAAALTIALRLLGAFPTPWFEVTIGIVFLGCIVLDVLWSRSNPLDRL